MQHQKAAYILSDLCQTLEVDVGNSGLPSLQVADSHCQSIDTGLGNIARRQLRIGFILASRLLTQVLLTTRDMA